MEIIKSQPMGLFKLNKDNKICKIKMDESGNIKYTKGNCECDTLAEESDLKSLYVVEKFIQNKYHNYCKYLLYKDDKLLSDEIYAYVDINRIAFGTGYCGYIYDISTKYLYRIYNGDII